MFVLCVLRFPPWSSFFGGERGKRGMGDDGLVGGREVGV